MKRFGLVLVLAGFSGCSSDSDKTANNTSALEVFPPHVYTGFDGTRTYKAPAIVVNASGATTWTIADPTIASLAPEENGEHLMVTALKAGETTITAKSGTQTATASLKVYAYTNEQWQSGSMRYTSSADASSPACNTCHGSSKGPDHTPTEVDADTDEEIQNTFLTGVDPEGRAIKDFSEFAALLQGKDHKWTVMSSEQVGLVAYMRSLAPAGWPEYDAPTSEK
jgi:hypothetical protein